MTHERHYLAGMTDYTGVALDDIIEHLQGWERSTDDAISRLEKHLEQVRNNADLLENPREVASYCLFFLDLFRRYASDIRRLLKELPIGVKTAHVEVVQQLYQSAKYEDDATVRFKNDWVYKSLPNESMRPLLDAIYADTRDVLIDYRDMSNVVSRLKTFVGSDAPSKEVLSDFQLKPNIFGIGLNLNRTLARLRDWWKS